MTITPALCHELAEQLLAWEVEHGHVSPEVLPFAAELVRCILQKHEHMQIVERKETLLKLIGGGTA